MLPVFAVVPGPPSYVLATVFAVVGLAMYFLGNARAPKEVDQTSADLPYVPGTSTITMVIIAIGMLATWLFLR